MSDELRNSVEAVCTKYIERVSEALDREDYSAENAQEDIRVVLRIYQELCAPDRRAARSTDN